MTTSSSGSKATPADTVAHVKQPIDWSANNTIEDLLVGECGTATNEENCFTPIVFGETANDTSQDTIIRVSSTGTRGDNACALYYNVLRYQVQLGLPIFSKCS